MQENSPDQASFSFKISATCSLYIIDSNRVLLLKREHTGFMDGNYCLVSGKLEQGETFREAMAREAKEEVNLDIKPADLELVYAMHRNQVFPDKKRERIDLYFKPLLWDGEIRNMEPEKHGDLAWFPLDDLPGNLVSYHRLAIGHIADKKYYSEIGF